MRKAPVMLLSISMGSLSQTSVDAIAAETSEAAHALEAVVVTATKEGAVSAQSVPTAISVFDADDVQQANLNSIEDLQRLTPGLAVSRNGSAARLYLRGIGTNLDFIGSDPSVTVQVDGVYQARGYTLLDDFLEVDRIEVLRGPQGTLYGRNSTGGTINVITRLPDAEPRAKLSAGAGNFNSRQIGAAVSGGLGSNGPIGSLAVQKVEHDPYVRNLNPDGVDGLLDDDSQRVAGSLHSPLGDNGELILRADHNRQEHLPGAYKATGLGLTGAPSALSASLDIPSDPFEINTGLADPFVDQRSSGESAELNWQLSERWRLSALTAYRKLDFTGQEDTDGSNADVLVTQLDEAQNQLSQELRLHYQNEGVGLSWVTGLFLWQEEHDSDATINGNAARVRNNYLASIDTDAKALFSQLNYPLAERLNATVGVRFSKEEKQFQNTNSVRSVVSGAQINGFNVDATADWQDVSPKLSLDYQLQEDALLYASVAKGFKSGGFNMTAADAEFDQEKVWAYEFGSKLDWLEKAVRTNLALFYYDYTDLQVSDFTQPGVLSISNAAEATNKGIEIENEWIPADDWMFSLNLAWLDARYDDYLAPLGSTLVDVSGNYLNLAPKKSASAAALYQIQSNLGRWFFRLEYSWRDKHYFTAFNQDVSAQDAYGLVNAQITLNSIDQRWQAQVFGSNLTDEDYSSSSREFPAASTGVTRDINPPRTFGARVTYHFL